MTYEQMRRDRYIDELARLFDNESSARDLLEDAGIPIGRVRPFGALAPAEYWKAVCRELEKGLIEDGFGSLLRAAARKFTHNPKLMPFLGGAPTGAHNPVGILVLAADPFGMPSLRLGEEARVMQDCLRLTGSVFNLKHHWATRTDDLIAAILRESPTILHFSGHGDPGGLIQLEDGAGAPKPVAPEALGALLHTVNRGGANPVPVRCVVLNSCYSADAAAAVCLGVSAVIGATDAILDAAAVAFSRGFYTGIANGQSVGMAVELGKRQIEIDQLDGSDLVVAMPGAGVDLDSLYLTRA